MTAQIQSLIDKYDSFELVCAKIATVLVEESNEQQRLAQGQSLDSDQWKLRVFTERATPWTGFKSADADEPQTPIVNVWFEAMAFDKAGSNVISRQKGVGTFHVDCYGFGFSKAEGFGHMSGDEMAAREAQRCVRLVRNILMSGYYTYLGFAQQRDLPEGEQQIVWGRWCPAITAFQPAQEDRPVERVAAMRLDLEVTMNEFSQEYVGQTLETVTVGFDRTPDGEWFQTDFDLTSTP